MLDEYSNMVLLMPILDMMHLTQPMTAACCMEVAFAGPVWLGSCSDFLSVLVPTIPTIPTLNSNNSNHRPASVRPSTSLCSVRAQMPPTGPVSQPLLQPPKKRKATYACESCRTLRLKVDPSFADYVYGSLTRNPE